MAWHPPPLIYSIHFLDMSHDVRRQRAFGRYTHTGYHEARVDQTSRQTSSFRRVCGGMTDMTERVLAQLSTACRRVFRRCRCMLLLLPTSSTPVCHQGLQALPLHASSAAPFLNFGM